jgi:hypothetical protein
MLQSVSASDMSRDAASGANSPPSTGCAGRTAGSHRGDLCRAICVAAYAVLTIALWGLAAAPAPAQPRGASVAGYFVDFRSRPAYLFGHSFIVYGRLDNRGKPVGTHLAGIYPIDGQAGLIMGSAVFPVRASVRAVHGDYQERPSNIYRRRLTAAQYARLLRVVNGLRRSEREWNLLFKNCNDFAIEVAKGMDMTTPPSWLPPYYFVAGLRMLNGR